MKIRTLTSFLVLFILSFAAPTLTSAQTSAASASGSYQFSLQDGYTKYVEFDARTQADGSATGSMFFSDEAPIFYQGVDETGDPSVRESEKGFYLKADFDGLTVNKNQAVMSGTVRDSSVREFIGQRVLLTVEDNGDNREVPDKLTWGIYPPAEKGWEVSDAERKDDDGANMRWIASDAERKDDVGVMYPLRDEAIGTQSFPSESYSYVEIERGAGDIKVQS